MKITIEVDCTPEEARSFMGLPDVSAANSVYVDVLSKAMKGAGSVDQVQEFAKNIAPMGQVGLKLFQQFMEGARQRALPQVGLLLLGRQWMLLQQALLLLKDQQSQGHQPQWQQWHERIVLLSYSFSFLVGLQWRPQSHG